MSDRPHRFSSIGRPIDPAYPTNRAIAALSLGLVLLGLLLGLLGGAEPPAALLRGLIWAAGFFLAWAIAREVDPDHPAAAFVAAGLSLVPLWLFERPAFAVLFLVLLVLRIVNRTVGPAARPIDTLVILGLVAVVSWQGHAVAAAIATAALVLDGILEPRYRMHLVAALPAAGLTILAAGRTAVSPLPGPDVNTWVALALAAPFLLLIQRSGSPSSVSDADALPLRSVRVRAAQILALAMVIAVAVAAGKVGLEASSSLWAAIAGTGLYAVLWRKRPG